ncbi:ATP-dependent translocase ABCB1-like [Babylonia areolata]|uniref:ATP-dependent translocase ABCB1-like n=1 Tax=Babylonia areolata TaxID=304850 RepID=UPI003FD3D387
MGVGLVCAFFSGVAIPMNAHMLGYVLNAIMLVGKNGTRFQDIHLVEEVDMLMYYELGVAAVSFLGGYGAVSLWSWSAARLGAKIRKCFLGSLMTQSVGWFEVNNIDELIVRFQIDIPKVDSGLGDRVPMCVQYLITWFTSYVVAFIGSWKLSLIIIFFTPVVIIVNRLVTKKIHNMALVDYQARASAGLSAEEALNRVSTVHAFETTDYECRRYEAQRQKYPLGEMQKAMVFGMGSAFPWVVNAMAFVVIFGYGDYLIREEGLDPGSVFPVFVGLLIALHAVQQFLFHLDIITAARNSLPPVLEVLECCSPINYFSDEGRVNKNGLSGEVAFRGVFFRFPKNIRNKVLNSLDIHITAKQSVALLSNHDYELSVIPKLIQRFYDINGGQRTVTDSYVIPKLIQRFFDINREQRTGTDSYVIPKLIQRFYDINREQYLFKRRPQWHSRFGVGPLMEDSPVIMSSVLLDHVDVREYQVRWLRHRISYISKESTIFPISVADNIRLGHDDVTQEDIEAAARDADLHNFVIRLKHVGVTDF